MTTIDAVRQPGTVLLDGATLDRLDAISVATGRTPAEVVALLVAEAPIGQPAPVVDPGECTGFGEVAGDDTLHLAHDGPCPVHPTPATIYVDPDGDTLALVPLEGRPADWAVRITTADPDGELDVFIEDDETLAGIGRSWLGAIEDRRR